MTLTRLIFIVLVMYGGIHWWQTRHVSYSPNVTTTNQPAQKPTETKSIISKNGYEIIPLQEFSIDARVLSAAHYSNGRESDLSQVDLALGWGRMSDAAILKDISIHQSGRFYYWHTNHFLIPRREIETHSANMHMIAADKDIEKKLLSIHQSQMVRISGYLVEAKANDGWHWRSSLTREDTGDGACELIYVRSVSVLNSDQGGI